jgi:hypothetical protein
MATPGTTGGGVVPFYSATSPFNTPVPADPKVVYFAKASDPVYRIHQTGWANPDIEGQLIHVPASARPRRSRR